MLPDFPDTTAKDSVLSHSVSLKITAFEGTVMLKSYLPLYVKHSFAFDLMVSLFSACSIKCIGKGKI